MCILYVAFSILLVILLIITLMVITLALYVRPSQAIVWFKEIPAFARVNTPKKGWSKQRRTVALPFDGAYEIPEDSQGHFVQLGKWHVNCRIDGETKRLTVPAKQPTDFASIPKLLYPLISPLSNSIYAAVLHDYLYRNPKDKIARRISKEEADRIFYWGLRAKGVHIFLSGLMYWGVRLGGKSSYKR